MTHSFSSRARCLAAEETHAESAESAEPESHAENAETAESISHAESAETAEPEPSKGE